MFCPVRTECVDYDSEQQKHTTTSFDYQWIISTTLLVIQLSMEDRFVCLLVNFCLGSSPDAYLSESVACPQGVHVAPGLYSTANDTQHRGRASNKSLNR